MTRAAMAYLEFERKWREKQEKDMAARSVPRRPAFRPSGGSELRSGEESTRGTAKYTPVVTKWDTTKAFSGSTRRARSPDGEVLSPRSAAEFGSGREEAILPDLHEKPGLKSKSKCFESVFVDLRKSAEASFYNPPKVNVQSTLDGRLKAVLPPEAREVASERMLVGHRAARPPDSARASGKKGSFFWRVGNRGEFQRHPIAGIPLNQ
jgi:hypothetical protein